MMMKVSADLSVFYLVGGGLHEPHPQLILSLGQSATLPQLFAGFMLIMYQLSDICMCAPGAVNTMFRVEILMYKISLTHSLIHI